jgi:hypothetical protein
LARIDGRHFARGRIDDRDPQGTGLVGQHHPPGKVGGGV